MSSTDFLEWWENDASIDELAEELRESIAAYNGMYASYERMYGSYERMRDSYYRMSLVDRYLFTPLVILVIVTMVFFIGSVVHTVFFGLTCRHCKQDIRNASPAIQSDVSETRKEPIASISSQRSLLSRFSLSSRFLASSGY